MDNLRETVEGFVLGAVTEHGEIAQAKAEDSLDGLGLDSLDFIEIELNVREDLEAQLKIDLGTFELPESTRTVGQMTDAFEAACREVLTRAGR